MIYQTYFFFTQNPNFKNSKYMVKKYEELSVQTNVLEK